MNESTYCWGFGEQKAMDLFTHMRSCDTCTHSIHTETEHLVRLALQTFLLVHYVYYKFTSSKFTLS